MNTVDVVAGIMFAGVVTYAVLGGADFGTGWWDLTAGGPRRGARMRHQIDHSLGPVWEANHVWLIFVLVFLWTGFPSAFSTIMTTLAVPLGLALLGIVLRGASFAFRKFADSLPRAQMFGVVFATSSFLTPFFLGAVAGALASGRVSSTGGSGVTTWANPTSVLGGTLAVVTCAYLAGLFLLADADREDTKLAEALRRKVLLTALVAGAAVLVGGAVLRADAPRLFHRLNGPGLPLVVLSAVAGAASVVLVHRRRDVEARAAGVVAVATVVAGWGFAQYPRILDDRSVDAAAGAPSTMRALIVVGVVALIVVGPALVWLFRLVGRPVTATGAAPSPKQMSPKQMPPAG